MKLKNKSMAAVMLMMFVLTAFLGGCGGNGSQTSNQEGKNEPVELKFGHVLAPTHPVQLAGEKFAELVAASTDEVKIEVYPQEQLGNEKTLPEGLTMGTVGGIILSSGGFGRLCPEISVIDAPYIWDSPEKMSQVLRGSIGDELKERVENEKQIHILDIWFAGTRHLTTKDKVIKSPEDLKGMKIRAPEIPLYMETVKAMGAAPTPISFGELFSALQTGIVDGQENPLAQIWTSKFTEVQKCLSLTGHISQGMVVAIQKKTWEDLSPEAQNVLTQAAYDAGDFLRQTLVDDDSDLLEKIKESGMQVTEVDRSLFRERMQPAIDKFSDDWEDYYQRIREDQN